MIVDAGLRLRALNGWRSQLEEFGWSDGDVELGLRYLTGAFALAERGIVELAESDDGRVTASVVGLAAEREERDGQEREAELLAIARDLFETNEKLRGMLAEAIAAMRGLAAAVAS